MIISLYMLLKCYLILNTIFFKLILHSIQTIRIIITKIQKSYKFNTSIFQQKPETLQAVVRNSSVDSSSPTGISGIDVGQFLPFKKTLQKFSVVIENSLLKKLPRPTISHMFIRHCQMLATVSCTQKRRSMQKYVKHTHIHTQWSTLKRACTHTHAHTYTHTHISELKASMLKLKMLNTLSSPILASIHCEGNQSNDDD